MNWRRFALLMTAACGGEFIASGHYLGAAVLLAFAIGVAVATEVKL